LRPDRDSRLRQFKGQTGAVTINDVMTKATCDKPVALPANVEGLRDELERLAADVTIDARTGERRPADEAGPTLVIRGK
jgi:hypothetical protein